MILSFLLATAAFAAPIPEVPARRSDFPKGFLWGAATAAYQVEGDNKGSDLWDWEGKAGWEPSGKATDSWERYAEDIRLLKDLGANTYRFSIEWGRVLPEPGKPDEAALARYGKILDALHAAGLRPLVTTHHFTNPRWFWRRHPKGWMDPGAVADYLDYVRLLESRFGPKVHDWVTFNEPMVYLTNGWLTGIFPPGERGVFGWLPETFMPAVQNIARAHRGAYRILHKKDVRVGLVNNITWVEPLDGEAKHVEAAKRWDWFFHWNLIEAAKNGTLDMDLDGTPETALDKDGPSMDFVGVNYYTRVYVRSFPFAFRPVNAFPFHAEVTWDRLGAFLFWLAGGKFGPGPKDDLGHELYPDGLRFVCEAAAARFHLPIIITENGVADKADAYRPAYIKGHLKALAAAVKEGVPLTGYVYWSLLDNYEWGSFKPRLGLYRVDREHGLKRSLTEGGKAFKEFLSRP